jgi:superfamily I DNA and/or RNA helicase
LPTELRAGLPGRGIVNYLEAQAVVRRLEALIADEPGQRAEDGAVAVLALYPAQVELLRRLIGQSAKLKSAAVPITVDLPAALRQRESRVVLLSLTRSHTHRAVSLGEGPQALTLALTRARARLILFGDPGTFVRRSQWAGALDHLDEAAAAREGQVVTRLVRYLQGQGRHPQAFHLSEGSSA